MCAAAAAAATAGYNPCLGSNPQAITCPGGELIRSPNPHSDNDRILPQPANFLIQVQVFYVFVKSIMCCHSEILKVET